MRAVAVDPGSHTWKVIACKEGRTGLCVTRFGVAQGAADGLRGLDIPMKGVVAGLAGRDMTLRYTQVPPSPDWQLRSLMDLEIQDIAGQSGGELSADYNLLSPGSDQAEMDTVLLALARNDALDATAQPIQGAGGSVAGHVPNCIALYNAYLRTAPIDDETQLVCLANIGRSTIDIALVRGHDLLFARNLSNGSSVLDDAIAASFGVSERKAESLKRELLDLDPESRGRFASGQAEKVTMAAGGAANAFVSAVQSSLAFCQSQTKVEGLQLDKLLLCGGGGRLRGVRAMLRESLRCPVELFDPFEVVDLSALPPDEAELLSEHKLEAVVALGLAIGQLDGDAYSLEILPEAVKRRQRFLQRTVYDIGAGVIGAALLAALAWKGGNELTEVQDVQAALAQQTRRIQNTHDEAAALVERNTADRAVAEELAERAVPLHGLMRTLRAVNSEGMLPPEVWITSVKVRRAGRGASARSGTGKPLVVLQGAVHAFSGRDVGEVYREFSLAFRQHELIAGGDVKARANPSERTFEITIDFMPDPKPEEDAEKVE